MGCVFLSCFSCINNPFGLPVNYEVLDVLGEGTYGVILRCWKKDIKRFVAVKLSKVSDNRKEFKIMEKFRRHNLHDHNIVRFLDSYHTPYGLALVMEHLDIDLFDYIHDMNGDELMTLSDIRCIIKQMAVALDALKNIGVIHTDIKPNNIMIVNCHERPFRAKLIDFGMAIHRNETRLGMNLQNRFYRAPEIWLGLPVTEAIDMWSLGCVMAYMMTNTPLFHGATADDIMKGIVFHCGQPPDHLLDKALYAETYFFKSETNRWTMKEADNRPRQRYVEVYVKKRIDNKTKAETLEAQQCINLLMAMLRIDTSERITPAEVLMHPFMTFETLSSGGDEASVSTPGDCTNIDRDHHSPSTTITLPRVIHVQPAKAENTRRLEDTQSSDSLHIQAIKTSRPVSSTDGEDPATRPKTTDIQPAHRSPSTTITLPRVIYVQPATAENTRRLEDHDIPDSFQGWKKVTATEIDTSTSTSEDFPACVKKQLPPPPVTESSSEKEKKKKNCFRRFFSWMKKTFCLCMTCVDDEKE